MPSPFAQKVLKVVNTVKNKKRSNFLNRILNTTTQNNNITVSTILSIATDVAAPAALSQTYRNRCFCYDLYVSSVGGKA